MNYLLSTCNVGMYNALVKLRLLLLKYTTNMKNSKEHLKI